MNMSLTVEDPLAEKEVTIHITLPVGKQRRSERSALLSVGVTGQLPVTMQGTFAQIPTLIDQAWTAFGVQAQLATAQSNKEADKPVAAAPLETAVSHNKAAEPKSEAAQPETQPDLSILF